MRIEHDFLGQMELEDQAYYGIQTVRGVQNSNVTGHTYGEDGMKVVRAMARIKKAAALANEQIGALDEKRAWAIGVAADEVLAGKLDDQFPVDMVTGGGGVSIHMNLNEVLAHRASMLLDGMEVHPNTHVNMGQSTNDVLPSAMLLTTHSLILEVVKAVDVLAEAVAERAEAFKDVVKLGRTCLQDAMPVTVGQELTGWHSFLLRHRQLLLYRADECLELPLGGTAVGTGVGAMPGYVEAVYPHLKTLTGYNVKPAANFFDAMQFADEYVHVSATLKSLAAGVSKMASDLRILSSGPRGGFGELRLPAVLPGSSIMPGKMNPILPELMIEIYLLVHGNDASVTMAAERGELDLNVWEAVITKCILESCRLLTRGLPRFARDCIAGLEVNEAHCHRQASTSAAIAMVISAVFGYETGSAVARKALEENKTVAEVAVEQGLMDEETAKNLLDPSLMTHGDSMADAIAKLRKAVKQ